MKFVSVPHFWRQRREVKHGRYVCWEWIGSKGGGHGGGYGQILFQGKLWQVSRLAWTLTFGPVPRKRLICHSCDNPPCFRPSHLWPGTYRQNTRDAARKGRMATGDRNGSRLHPERRPRGDANSARRHPELHPRGERSGNAKLRLRDVIAIRAVCSMPGLGAVLARKYNVSQQLISAIRLGYIWKEAEACS